MGNDHVEDEPKSVFYKNAFAARANALEIIASGAEQIKIGQRIVDITDAIIGLANASPSTFDFDSQTNLYKQLNGITYRYNQEKEQQNSLLSVAGTISMTSASACSSVYEQEIDHYRRIEFCGEGKKFEYDNFVNVINHPIYRNEVRTLIIEWGFDKSSLNRKSGVELFDTAYDAFEQPVNQTNPISTSLIPMRECILEVISGLLYMRPQRSNYQKSQAIYAFASQLKKDSLDDSVIEYWSKTWAEIHDDLSGSKQSRINRDDWAIKLQRATLLLDSILTGLDINKARKNLS